MGKILNIEEDGKKFIMESTYGKDASSKGMLYKWTGTIDGELVFIKTGLKYTVNAYSDIQPITEVLVSDILDILGVDHARYYFDYLERDGKTYPVCYSYDFAKKRRYSAMSEFGVSQKDAQTAYTMLCKRLGIKKELDTMIVVDCLINNIDRHFRNFGMLMSEDRSSVKFAPIFDHGHSLYGDIFDEILEKDKPEDLEKVDECRTFCDSHYDQIKLVSDIEFKVNLQDLLDIVEKYRGKLKDHRIDCIKHLLTVRYNLLKKEGIFIG